MKKSLFLFLVVSVPLFLSAADKLSTDISWVFKTTVMSEYLAKPGITLHDQPILINEVTGKIGPWYGGIWSSVGLTDRGER